MGIGISFVNVYRAAQMDYSQVTTASWMLLHLRGMWRFEVPSFGVNLVDPGPFFMLLPARVKIHFTSAAPRENWVAFAAKEFVSIGDRPGSVKVCVDGLQAEFGVLTPLENADAGALQMDFVNLRDCLASPFDGSELMAELSAAAILRTVLRLNLNLQRKSNAPARTLKDLLDSPQGGSRCLSTLARNCGYSADHLRKLFKEQYGMLPHEYAIRKTMSCAMDLLANSDLRTGEISDKLGFKHVSHFSACFRKHFGICPSEAIRHFRERRNAMP